MGVRRGPIGAGTCTSILVSPAASLPGPCDRAAPLTGCPATTDQGPQVSAAGSSRRPDVQPVSSAGGSTAQRFFLAREHSGALVAPPPASNGAGSGRMWQFAI